MSGLGYLAALVMGLSLGMIGGGGSILTVPILVYIFQINPVLATGNSLFIVGTTASFAVISYMRKGLVDYRTAINFAIPSFLGVLTSRVILVPQLPELIFQRGAFVLSKPLVIMLAFGILMMVASYSMIVGFTIKKRDPSKAAAPKIQKIFWIGFQGLMVGLIAGFVGAGGGFLIIPGLVVLVGLPMPRAIATSLLIIAAQSLVGFIGDLQHHSDPNWIFLLSFAGVAVVGSLAGSRLGARVSEQRLKKGFGWFVLLMGSGILIQQLAQLH